MAALTIGLERSSTAIAEMIVVGALAGAAVAAAQALVTAPQPVESTHDAHIDDVFRSAAIATCLAAALVVVTGAAIGRVYNVLVPHGAWALLPVAATLAWYRLLLTAVPRPLPAFLGQRVRVAV